MLTENHQVNEQYYITKGAINCGFTKNFEKSESVDVQYDLEKEPVKIVTKIRKGQCAGTEMIFDIPSKF
jgi:hypothetical protein